VRDIGEKSGREKTPNKRIKKRGIRPKKKCFDASCIVKKRELNIILKKVWKEPYQSRHKGKLLPQKEGIQVAHQEEKIYVYFKDINKDSLIPAGR
jgi:hypothetical protein